MTYAIGQTVFWSIGRFCRMTAVAAPLMLGACASANVDNAAPGLAEGPRDTGSFPNLNVKPEVAAQQFTDADKTGKLAELKADQTGQGNGGGRPSGNDAAILSSLAKNHARDTLKQIEGKCDPALDPACK